MKTSPTLYGDLDPGIRDLVRWLRDRGFNTTCACEGGAGHSYERPTIEVDLANLRNYVAVSPGCFGGAYVVFSTPKTTAGDKTVEVRSYLRCRLGVWQTVISHMRRRPRLRRGR
jgi:hypothetical protein